MGTHANPYFARVNSWSTDMRYAPGTIAVCGGHGRVRGPIGVVVLTS